MPEQWQHQLRKLKRLDPPPGLWDRAAARSPREPPRMRRTCRLAAPLAAALAIVVVAAGTFALVRVFSPVVPRAGTADSHRPGRFVDPGFGWSIRVPGGLTARHFRSTDRVTSDGVRVASFRPGLQVAGTGTPPMGWLRRFPADGVAVQIWSSEGGPAGPPPLRDSTFPLSPSSFRRVSPYAGGSEPRSLVPRFLRGRVRLHRRCLGRSAGQPRRSASRLGRGAVAALPAIEAGHVLARHLLRARPFLAIPDPIGHDVPALGPAGQPRGVSVARPGRLLPDPRPPCVLRHPPPVPDPAKPHTRCTLALDRKAFQFYCPGTSLRWNRVGQAIGAHAGSGPDGDLSLVPATVAQDGHILFSPFWGDVLRVDLQGSPWG